VRHCNPEGAEILFDNVLDRVTGSDPSVTDYILESPAKCPNCRREILRRRWLNRHNKSACAVARNNAAVLAARYPSRPRIEIQIGDATTPRAAGEHVVYFMYHAFGAGLMTRLVESQSQHGLQHAFFVYYNPVQAALLDRSPRFERWSAGMLPYAPEDLGYGPDVRELDIAIWRPAYVSSCLLR